MFYLKIVAFNPNFIYCLQLLAIIIGGSFSVGVVSTIRLTLADRWLSAGATRIAKMFKGTDSFAFSTEIKEIVNPDD